ncbi:hypothetical protein IWQ62_000573 [Dispira parvispora]|uniref:Major facilitator superfamily (MFS) profile domain-containing protein n=1 Tax=Dispira parvispora TaxID=1520584 RepID=A0A9W8AUE7_9FUNG|nr:hypothetical protein IWQ62_000573 [Dispira parvispora]
MTEPQRSPTLSEISDTAFPTAATPFAPDSPSRGTPDYRTSGSSSPGPVSSNSCETGHFTVSLPPLTPQQRLDHIISRIGFGKFQQRMLLLCGLGWLADNMWLQCVANILPRIQRHFSISDPVIGIMSSSIFTGMMLGALFWGFVLDTHGRRKAFRWTLSISSGFGLAAGFSQSFPVLCFFLFGLGFGVGGNMPVDGAVFLEFIPKEYRYLLTLLSVFFSAGAVVASGLALAVLPPFSCTLPECDVHQENNGWRYLLILMGLLNSGMLMARTVFFQSQESPKFLVNKERHRDAIVVLRNIVKYNGDNLQLSMQDLPGPAEGQPLNSYTADDEATSSSPRADSREGDIFIENCLLEEAEIAQKGEPGTHVVQRAFHRGLRMIQPLFTPAHRRVTILVWTIWALVALGYTMFNAFLPKILEGRDPAKDQSPSMISVYRQALVYALGSVPGPILGAYLVQTRLGSRGAMAGCTFGAALALGWFTLSRAGWTSTVASSTFSLLAGTMYAIIYSYTPEAFQTSSRGTACGIASALGRVAGVLAPLVAGVLWTLGPNWLLSLSITILVAAGMSMLGLPSVH